MHICSVHFVMPDRVHLIQRLVAVVVVVVVVVAVVVIVAVVVVVVGMLG